MSDRSAIQWTDATWNPVRGCTKVSPGCAHCYAETFAERFRGVKGHPYEQGFDLRLVPDKLDEPLRWKKPRRIFVNSMSDLFQDGVPDSFIDQVFAVMALARQHTFQVLTKRADRMRAYFDKLEFEPERVADAADLRDSGSIEQDADVVIFVYRDEVYHPDHAEQHGIAELIVAKQRNGPVGTLKLAFVRDYTRFENLAPSETYEDRRLPMGDR